MKSKSSDVIALLKKDHQDVKKLFKQFEQSDNASEKNTLAGEICNMLTVHATCEEELVYPAAREVFDEDDQKLVSEAAIEHATAKDLIAKIEGMTTRDEDFEPTVKVLSEYINHHVAEEEGEMFPRLKESDLDLDDLGERVSERKNELMESGVKDKRRRSAPRAR
jgi:hemerythrin superfamily protein